MIQFPMMFLSGAFFRIDEMPQFLQVIARLIPLTYLADALRQVMVGGAAFAPWGLRRVLSAGWWSASGSRRASSSGSRAGAGYQRSSRTSSSRAPTATRRGRPGEVRRVGRIAERQQVLAMPVGRVAEEAPGEVVLVDGRRHAADAELPGRQHHVLGGLAQVQHDRERAPLAARIPGRRAGPA